MTDPEITVSDDGWTGDLVPPMEQANLVDTDARVVLITTPADAEPILTEVSLY